MTIEYLVDNYPDLERYIELIYEEHGEKLNLTKKIIGIPVPLIQEKVKIHETQLGILSNGDKPDAIPSLKYIDSYGIKFRKYYEICISIQGENYIWLEGNEWRTDPLRFKIGSTQFEISPISSLMVLLTEPIYKEECFPDFDDFASVKMVISKADDFKDEFSKGIYYLNSHYLKPIGFHASINNLEFKDYDPFDLLNISDPESVFEPAKRKRNITRKNFLKCEPLNLYNYAITAKGEQQFLSYYRVLEYFMEQALIRSAKKLRFDSSVSDEELVKEISIKQERGHLKNLIKIILNQRKKTKLMNFCIQNELIDKRTIDKVANELYEFRNSIVHAKENKAGKTYFPNPFQLNSNLNKWISIVEELARECITSLNTE